MLSQSTLLILGGCLLGTIQLIAGVAIGIWIRRADKSEADRGRHAMLHANAIAKRLKALAGEMSTSALEHRSQLEQASQMLKSDDGGNDSVLAELVVDVIDDMVHANHNLQSKLETAEGRLKEQAVEIEAHISRSLTDPLTGLPNRREFNERLEERMSAWNRRREVFSLLMLDVDHFKAMNDKYGHPAGDQVLRTIARTLRTAVRREDAVARYGGEEFAILLPNSTLEQAALVAEKVREAVSRVVVEHNCEKIAVTASGGLAVIGPGDTVESLIQRADAALYAAKASGRNRTCTHDGVGQVSPTDPGGRLGELIKAAEADSGTAGDLLIGADLGFGSFLPRDEISPALTETCNELRRVVEERRLHCPDTTPSVGS